MFVLEGLKLAPTEFVLSFQFQINVSAKSLFRAPKLTFSHGKRLFLFSLGSAKTLVSACKTNLFCRL